MSLFGFRKKKEEENKTSCCCGNSKNASVADTAVSGEISSIKVLGAGCKSCHEQYQNVINAAAEMLSKILNFHTRALSSQTLPLTWRAS